MITRPANLELLRRSPFVAAAGDAAMAVLLRHGFVQLLPRGSVLFEQDEPPGFVHCLLEGTVGLRAHDDAGRTAVVEFMAAGELFVVPAVMLTLPYLVTGVALTEVRVLMFPADIFRTAVARDPALANAVNQMLSRHWRLLVDQIVDLKLRGAEQRVARFLARRLREDVGAGVVELPEPRSAIAARLGMTPETLSRALTALEKRGAIRVSLHRVDVFDRDRLI